MAFPPGQCTSPQLHLVTDYLTKMSIKTAPHPPCSPDLAPCDFWLFPMLRGCCYETIEEMKEAVTEVIDMITLPWGLPEVIGMVQVHCSRRRLLRMRLEFHVCTINKSVYTYISLETYRMHLVLSFLWDDLVQVMFYSFSYYTITSYKLIKNKTLFTKFLHYNNHLMLQFY